MTAELSTPVDNLTARPRSTWRILVDFWTRPIQPEPLALFRILLGATALISLTLSMAPYLELYLGEHGLCPPRARDAWMKRTGRFCWLRGPSNIPGLQNWLPSEYAEAWAEWGATTSAVILLFFVWLGALLAMTVGFLTRTSTFIAWLLTVSFHNRLSWVLNGGDAVFRVAVFYLMLAPAGKVWSVDHWLKARKRRKHGAAAETAPVNHTETIPPWSVRLMQIQICCVYLFTGLAKIGDDWINGEALYWVLNDVRLNRWPYHWFPVPLMMCRLLSWATIGWELGFPLLVLNPRVRPWVLAFGVALHLGILATMEIGWFSQFTLCWYVLFLSPAQIKALFGRVRACAFRKQNRYRVSVS